jgi:hypothetical protein
MKLITISLLTAILISTNVFSQENTTSLVCTGKYNNYKQNFRDVDVTGGVIQLQSNNVKVGIIGFSYSNGDFLDYKILSTSESKISFQHSDKGLKYFGVLNRYSGEVDLSESYDNKFVQIFKGKCTLGKKMF